MPANIVKSFADKTDKSESEVEELWQKAKEIATEQGRSQDYEYITGILKQMLDLNESSIGYQYTNLEEAKNILDGNEIKISNGELVMNESMGNISKLIKKKNLSSFVAVANGKLVLDAEKLASANPDVILKVSQIVKMLGTLVENEGKIKMNLKEAKEVLEERKKYIYDIYTKKSGKLVKLDSLNDDEYPDVINSDKRFSVNKLSNLIVKRSDGKEIHYDAVGDEWVINKKIK